MEVLGSQKLVDNMAVLVALATSQSQFRALEKHVLSDQTVFLSG